MGAEPWSSFTKFDSDVQRALDNLRRDVFAAGAYRYAEEDPSSIEEALEIADADGTMNIFVRLRDGGKGSPVRVFHTPSEENGPAASVAVTWFPLVSDAGADQDWRLIVRHRRGGALGAFIADSRRRDLEVA